MGSLRAGFSLISLGVLFIVFFPFQWVSVRFGLAISARIPILFHKLLGTAIGLRVTVTGGKKTGFPTFLVSNHISWMDIVVLGQLAPLSFIAKSEVAAWPFFGTLARLQRTIFVDRQKRSNTGRVNDEISARLMQGETILLFGEGTSSDGNRILPFRTSLFGAVTNLANRNADNHGRIYIQPVAIAYQKLHGLPLGWQHKHRIAWFGDMDLLPHLWAALQEGALDVDICFGEPMKVDGNLDRKKIAKLMENRVRDLFNDLQYQ
ncbi:MAG: 1-acyl-sn-glycerol-3-phosphate acyltransferase [Cohaesibacteraceae bacterium]|nr:1-acyl-sn-glycerol-3-phosphate acyltransferase [Cohaesibacteraceae bacterium]MBL4875124.1 1-acyl-sn-glycerol-3-phosphate acyltransferase [Cohaesibacteraceae bacterium]